jgi:hypothetical protein
MPPVLNGPLNEMPEEAWALARRLINAALTSNCYSESVPTSNSSTGTGKNQAADFQASNDRAVQTRKPIQETNPGNLLLRESLREAKPTGREAT